MHYAQNKYLTAGPNEAEELFKYFLGARIYNYY